MQATVTPAPNAEPPPGSGQNTGVGGTTHAIAYDGGSGASDRAAEHHRAGRRPRRIRYANSEGDQVAQAAPAAGPTAAVPAARVPPADPVLSGTAVPGPGPADDEPDEDGGSAGVVYETPPAAFDESSYGHAPNEGLEIFDGVATTEVPTDDVPAGEFEDPLPEAPPPGPAPVIPVGAAWNEPIAPPPVASGPTQDSATQDRKPSPLRRIRGVRLGSGQPEDEGVPRVNVRDLPPDVQLRFIRDRVIIVVVVGVASYLLWQTWPVSVTLAIVAWIADMLRRQRTAQLYVQGGPHPGARKATSKQLRRMRRAGYYTLDARPIPDSREVIDHLVVGPTGVYAIDSEKWNPKVPVRTLNGNRLYHGPESQKDRLEHAVWEASQASGILSGALGFEVKVRPALAIYGPRIPWDIATIRNVDVFTGPSLGKYLKARRRQKDGVIRLTSEEAQKIYEVAAKVLPEVTQTYTPVSS